VHENKKSLGADNLKDLNKKSGLKGVLLCVQTMKRTKRGGTTKVTWKGQEIIKIATGEPATAQIALYR